MPIARVKNRKRPKNPGNRQVEADRAAAQSRWLVHGNAETHEERLNLAQYTEAAETAKAESKAADKAANKAKNDK